MQNIERTSHTPLPRFGHETHRDHALRNGVSIAGEDNEWFDEGIDVLSFLREAMK
jgi:hypothetical protein